MWYTAGLLVIAILAIIVLGSRYRFHTFFVLLSVAVLTGLFAGLGGEQVLSLVKAGFGHTLEKIGLLIILGTTLGLLLETSRATLSLANYLLARTGEKQAPLALTGMGFVVGLPIFCDSGFVVLSGLALMLSRRLPGLHTRLVLSLALALYSVHCLVPPHPGISAAAGMLKADLGQAMLMGSALAILPLAAAYLWIRFRAPQSPEFPPENTETPEPEVLTGHLPSPLASFLPVITPILLIALKSLLTLFPALMPPLLLSVIRFVGDPVMALTIGIVMALLLFPVWDKGSLHRLLEQSIEKSGPILAIIAAGGAFGEVIKAMDIGTALGAAFSQSHLGLLIPFALAVIFKTAQGSSTVAVISAAGITEPLLAALGLDSEMGRLFTLMALGSGSMMVSHANDAYFWVISRFGHISSPTLLRVYSTAGSVMGIVSFVCLSLAYALFSFQ